jgi:hypothetical protein
LSGAHKYIYSLFCTHFSLLPGAYTQKSTGSTSPSYFQPQLLLCVKEPFSRVL